MKQLTDTEYSALLGEDAIQLEKAIPPEKFAIVRQNLTDAMMTIKVRFIAPKYDTALDVAIEGLPVKDRVEIQMAAKQGGYVRPEWSDTRSNFWIGR